MLVRKRIGMIAAMSAAGALLLTGCGTDTPPDPAVGAGRAVLAGLNFLSGTAKENRAVVNTGDWANKPGKHAPAPLASKWVQLTAVAAKTQDSNVINGAGYTLYRFDKDRPSPPKSNCDGGCAATWPPVIIDPEGKIFVDGVKQSTVGVVKREDGTLQVTLGGQPVYRYSGDLEPGDINGYGVDGAWFSVTPDGMAGVDEG